MSNKNSVKIDNDAFFKISYGLYIVSSKHNEKINGYVSNAVFQVTAEPAQFAVCCSKDNFTSELIEKSGILSISILKKDASPEIIGAFGYKSGREIEKFKNVNYTTGITGAPILTQDTIAWFDCRVAQKMDVGTHILFTAEIIESSLLDTGGEPLTYSYYREVRKGKAPKNAPTYISPDTITGQVESGSKYKCLICGHVYDPDTGDPEHDVPAGTCFDNLPENWQCPVCGTDRGSFDEL